MLGSRDKHLMLCKIQQEMQMSQQQLKTARPMSTLSATRYLWCMLADLIKQHSWSLRDNQNTDLADLASSKH